MADTIERMQPYDTVLGYNYNRLVDVLNGQRTTPVTIAGTASFQGNVSISGNQNFSTITASGLAEFFGGDPWYDVKGLGAVGDGVTDDTTPIQTAINTASTAGGGIVFFPPGTYKTSASLIVNADNVVLLGTGRKSTIQAANNFPPAPMVWVKSTGINGLPRFGFKMLNLRLACSGPTGITGVQLDSTYWATIQDVDIEGVYANNIYLNGDVVFGAYTKIDHCHIGNIPGGATSSGIGIKTNNHEFNVIRDCTINWFVQPGGIGINLFNINNVIQGCSFDECDTSIRFDFTQNNTITECQFDRGVTQFIYFNGSKFARVANNWFGSFVGTNTGTQTILHVGNGYSTNNIFMGNQATTFSTPWPSWLIEDNGVGTPANLYIANDTTGLPVTRLTGIFRSNVGYNPVGSLSTPAIPTSHQAYTNNFGVDATVHVTGGSVTDITVGSGSTGLMSGSFRVPAGQTITLTYTIAPTWTWFGD